MLFTALAGTASIYSAIVTDVSESLEPTGEEKAKSRQQLADLQSELSRMRIAVEGTVAEAERRQLETKKMQDDTAAGMTELQKSIRAFLQAAEDSRNSIEGRISLRVEDLEEAEAKAHAIRSALMEVEGKVTSMLEGKALSEAKTMLRDASEASRELEELLSRAKELAKAGDMDALVDSLLPEGGFRVVTRESASGLRLYYSPAESEALVDETKEAARDGRVRSIGLRTWDDSSGSCLDGNGNCWEVEIDDVGGPGSSALLRAYSGPRLASVDALIRQLPRRTLIKSYSSFGGPPCAWYQGLGKAPRTTLVQAFFARPVGRRRLIGATRKALDLISLRP